MFNFIFPVQSEPLYVPVKFQDVPAEHSNCLMGDCESCKYTEWRIQMEYVSLLPLIVQKLSQKISWRWALTSWGLILSPLWEISASLLFCRPKEITLYSFIILFMRFLFTKVNVRNHYIILTFVSSADMKQEDQDVLVSLLGSFVVIHLYILSVVISCLCFKL